MKAVLVALGLLVVSAEAHAISRYTSTSMTCNEIKARIRDEGAVLLNWRSQSGIPRYNRFVYSNQFCSAGERAEITYVPSADRQSCPVRACKYWDPDDDIILFQNWR